MTKQYSSSLTNAQWQVIANKLPEQILKRKRRWTLRTIFDAIFYSLKNGCIWHDLPGDFPPSGTVYYYFAKWRDDGLLQSICTELGGDYRELMGKQRSPSVGIMDAQSVKGTAVSATADTGYDAGKKVKGRKRHLMVDTLGLIIAVWVTSAEWQDRTAAYWLFVKLHMDIVDFFRLKTFFADGGYAGELVEFVKNQFRKWGWQLQIVKKDKNIKGFVLLPKRWIVERTFAWFDNCRRLTRDYERKTTSSEAFIYLCQIRLLAIRCGKT